MYEYIVARCEGEDNVAQCINDAGSKGFEPLICTFTGNANKESLALVNSGRGIVPTFMMILRRPKQVKANRPKLEK